MPNSGDTAELAREPREATVEVASDRPPVEEAPATAEAPARAPGGAGRWLGVVVSLVALIGVGWWVSQQEPPRFPTSARALGLLAAAVAIYGAIMVVRGWRWHLILLRAGIAHRRGDAYGLVTVGYMANTVLPARAGEVVRVLLLAGRSSGGRREILGSVVAERVLDAAALIAICATLSLTSVGSGALGRQPAVLAAVCGVLAVVALAGYRALRRRTATGDRILARLDPFVRALRVLPRRLGAMLGGVTVLIWVAEGVIFWLVAESLDVEITVLEGVFLAAIVSFFSLIPAAPGYIGTFDAGVVFGLNALGVAGSAVLTYVLLIRFVIFVPVTVAGLVLTVTHYGGIKRLRPAAAGRV